MGEVLTVRGHVRWRGGRETWRRVRDTAELREGFECWAVVPSVVLCKRGGHDCWVGEAGVHVVTVLLLLLLLLLFYAYMGQYYERDVTDKVVPRARCCSWARDDANNSRSAASLTIS